MTVSVTDGFVHIFCPFGKFRQFADRPSRAAMINDAELTALAEQMKKAQDEAYQISPFSLRATEFDVHFTYAVAHLIHRERVREGSIPVGRRIGFTNLLCGRSTAYVSRSGLICMPQLSCNS